MLRRHNHDRAHTVRRKGRQNKDVVAGDVVITPLEAEMLRVLVDAPRGPASVRELTHAPFVKGTTGLQ